MTITARKQVNQVAVTTQRQQTPMTANVDHITTDAAQTNTSNRHKFNNNCHRCG